MNFEKKISKVFGLNKPEKWLKHANPYSLVTRIIVLPLLIFAIWSRIWIGWYSIFFILGLIIWLIINPTVFKKSIKIKSWWQKGVLGEYFWINKDNIPVLSHHIKFIKILMFLQGIGSFVLVVGLYKLNICLTFIGTIIIYFAKLWFLDRMVWIYYEMKNLKEYKEIFKEIRE
jgi:hypothetical protein